LVPLGWKEGSQGNLPPLFLFMKLLLILLILSGCQKPIKYEELPETKYPETPTMGAWEPLKE